MSHRDLGSLLRVVLGLLELGVERGEPCDRGVGAVEERPVVALDSDGRVAKVEFRDGTTLLGQDTSAPYSYTWRNVP